MKRPLVLAFAASLALTGCGTSKDAVVDRDAEEFLSFYGEGHPYRKLTKRQIEASLPIETFTAFDPNYRKAKTWKAVSLYAILREGFAGQSFADQEFLLEARDGTSVPISAMHLLATGGYIALADVEVPGWEPIGPQQANPGPFYVVWREPWQLHLKTYPRPWQLSTIQLGPLESIYRHIAPPGLPEDAPAMKGFRIFRNECIGCHAINREGGRVGPDLNVPQSIVEYRPEEQIRAYILNPRQFRYGNMPAHQLLRGDDLDALIAYFHAMKSHKHDPEQEAP